MSRGFESESVWKSRGRGFSMGVVQPEGRIIHFTGQVAGLGHEDFLVELTPIAVVRSDR